MEELSCVYAEVQLMEKDFKKAIEMFWHLSKHSRQLFVKNKEIGTQFAELSLEH